MNTDYNHAKINFEDGLLEIVFHSGGGPLLWTGAVHELLGYGLALEGLAVVDQGQKI